MISSKGHLIVRAEYQKDGSVAYRIMLVDAAKKLIVVEGLLTADQYLDLIGGSHKVEMDYTLKNPV
jgi:hypothetical protein